MATVLGIERRKDQGQLLTVPEWVEQKLGLQVGDALLFMMDDDGRIFVQREERRPLEDVIGSLKTDRPFLTDDELDAELERVMADELREKYDGIFKERG